MIHAKNFKKLTIMLILMSMVLASCIPKYLIPNSADLTTAQSHWPSATAPQLKEGYNIYIDQCTDCHRLKKLKKFSEDEWVKVMPKMGRKAHLDSAQYSNVVHYIFAKRENILAKKKK